MISLDCSVANQYCPLCVIAISMRGMRTQSHSDSLSRWNSAVKNANRSKGLHLNMPTNDRQDKYAAHGVSVIY